MDRAQYAIATAPRGGPAVVISKLFTGNDPDGATLTETRLRYVRSVASDGRGNLLFCDSERVRSVDLETGVVESLAGTFPLRDRQEDLVPATATDIGYPEAVALDPGGHLWIAADDGDLRLVW